MSNSPAVSPATDDPTSVTDQTHWAFPTELQPKGGEVPFDLGVALHAVVALRVEVPDDAFTAPILGTERTGNGVVINDDGLVLTIGYLITEAETIWLTTHAGTVVPGHALAYDPVTGLGLVLPLGKLDVGPIARTDLESADLTGDVFVIGHGGRGHALKARVFARREFAGYWEYLLDEALFTTPPHPEWSGPRCSTATAGSSASARCSSRKPTATRRSKATCSCRASSSTRYSTTCCTSARVDRPPRPWLGLYTAETRDGIAIQGLATEARRSAPALQLGDIVHDVAGADRRPRRFLPLCLAARGRSTGAADAAARVARPNVTVRSVDRSALLKNAADAQ